MADTIERIYKLTVDGAAAVRQLDQIASNTDKLNGKFDKMAATAIKVGSAIVSAFAVGSVVSAIKRNIDAMDELSKAVSKVGIAAEDLQRLRYAADLSGVSAEALDKAIGRLAVGMSELSEGTSDTAQALRAMGAKEGEGPLETLTRISDKFQAMPDGIAKTNLAIKLFGKSVGPDMIPLLNEGGAALKKLADEADRFGGVVSGNVLKAAEQLNDNLSRLERTANGIGVQLVSGMLPGLQTIAQALTDSANSGTGFVSVGLAIGEVLADIAGYALKAGATIRAFFVMDQALGAALREPWKGKSIISQAIDEVNELDRVTNEKLAKMRADFALFKDQATAPPAPAAPPKPPGVDPLKAAADAAAAAEKAQKARDEGERRRMLVAGILIELEKEQEERNKALAEQTARYAKETEDAAKAQRDLIRALDPAGAAAEDYATNLAAIDKLYFDMTIGAEQYERMMAQLNDTWGKTAKDMADESDVLNDGFKSFFNDVAQGAGDIEEVFKKTAKSIIAELLKIWAQRYIIQAIFGGAAGGGAGAPAAIAHGAAFDAGRILPFARGGIISRPVVFPMALAGEAGPEAIMPLARGRDGNLGVQAQAATMNVTVKNYADTRVSTRRTGASELEIVIEQTRAAIAADLRSGGNPVSRSLEQAYGIGRGAAAAF